jgi:hypothetical protein
MSVSTARILWDLSKAVRGGLLSTGRVGLKEGARLLILGLPRPSTKSALLKPDAAVPQVDEKMSTSHAKAEAEVTSLLVRCQVLTQRAEETKYKINLLRDGWTTRKPNKNREGQLKLAEGYAKLALLASEPLGDSHRVTEMAKDILGEAKARLQPPKYSRRCSTD